MYWKGFSLITTENLTGPKPLPHPRLKVSDIHLLTVSGHDTTASAICWTLCSLAEHPEHQRRIQQELDEVLKGRESDDILW